MRWSDISFPSFTRWIGFGTIVSALGASSSLHAQDAAPWYDDVRTRTGLFLGASVLGVATYGATKWWDTGLRDFRSHGEGWFGAGTEKGGADKLGHAFGTYTGVRAGAQALQWLGNNREDALMLATTTTLLVYTGIEVLDGFSKQYKFSHEDVIANLAGAGFGWVTHRYPALDALVDFRLYYRQSPQAKAEGAWEPFNDYNGQRYLIALKASGVPALEAQPVLRYAELVFGYGVHGYDPPAAAKSRHLYAGVAMNLARVLDDTVFVRNRGSAARQGTGLFLELFQVPGTVAFVDRKL
jgi:hypothetical protein